MDSSPLKNHAATVNGPTWRQGKFGGGLFCDGVDDYVEIPNSPALENIQESSFTLSAWFLPEDAPPRGNAQTGTAYAIVAKPGMHIGLTYLAHHRFSMQYFLAPKQPQGTVGKGAIPPVARQGQYPPGSFYHVAGVVNWQSRTNRVYVNGKLEATTSWAPGPRAVEYGQKTWKIGIANPGLTNLGWRARGTIDEVRIYNRALAPTEIRVLAGTGR